jgi:exopolysaccharide biosynthesis polyprenyl glycosylphosphotransferase
LKSVAYGILSLLGTHEAEPLMADPVTSAVELGIDDAAAIVVLGAGERRSRFSILRRRGPWRDALRRRLLAVADALAVAAATAGVAIVTGRWTQAMTWSLLLLPAWLVLAKLQGLYDRDQRTLRHQTADEFQQLLVWATTGTAVVTAVLLLTPPKTWSTATAVGVWAALLLCAFTLRACARRLWRLIVPPERVLIVGSGQLADVTCRKLNILSDIHARVVGRVDEAQTPDVAELVDGHRLERIILAAPSITEGQLAQLMTACRRHELKLAVVPPVRGMFGTAVQLNHLAELPLVEYHTADIGRSTLAIKRCIDIVVSAVALALFAIPLALIALLVRLDSHGPAFFIQRRVGRAGRPFTMFKFRTMVSDAEDRLLQLLEEAKQTNAPAFKFRDDPRVTRFGRFLRRTSIDELPQLLNVLHGDMSLVGPRPEECRLVARYPEAHRVRLMVRPGLTGPMQVQGRGELTFEERLAVERDYVENLTIGRDVRIMLQTAAAVRCGRGAY